MIMSPLGGSGDWATLSALISVVVSNRAIRISFFGDN
jgi:hypothetical protein